MYQYDDDEVMRYRKKSSRKPPKKSSHKHLDANCVFLLTNKYNGEVYPTIGLYCPICGKVEGIIDVSWRNERTNRLFNCDNPEFWNEAAQTELCEETRTLPCFKLDGWFDKYVKSE